MQEAHDWMRILKDLAHTGDDDGEGVREPDDIGTITAGPHPGLGLAERFRAKGPLSEEQAALLDGAEAMVEEMIDRKLHAFAGYLATILKRQS